MLNCVLFSAIFKFSLETQTLCAPVRSVIKGVRVRECWVKDPKGD